MSRCDCCAGVNRDIVDWWLSNVAKERAEKLIDSMTVADLSASVTVRDHDVGNVVLERWPNWFEDLKADFQAAESPLVKMLMSRFSLSEWNCRSRAAGYLGAMAKERHSRHELKKLIADNRTIRKIQNS
jgi:hypothetical protein